MRYMSRIALSGLLMATAVSVVSTSSAWAFGADNIQKPKNKWQVSRIEAAAEGAKSYCALINQFENNMVLALARDGSGQGSVALDLKRAVFETGQTYNVKININDEFQRKLKGVASNAQSLIVQMGRDEGFYPALTKANYMGVTTSKGGAHFDMQSVRRATDRLNECADSLSLDDNVEQVQSIAPQTIPEQTKQAEQVEQAEPVFANTPTPVAQAVQDGTKASDTEMPSVELTTNVDEALAGTGYAEYKTSYADQYADMYGDTRAEDYRRELNIAKDMADAKAEVAAEQQVMAERRKKIESLMAQAEQQPVGNVPLSLVQGELIQTHEDLERRAVSQAQQAEWLEQEHARLEKMKEGYGIEDSQYAELEAARVEIEKLRQQNQQALSHIASLEKMSSVQPVVVSGMAQERQMHEQQMALDGELTRAHAEIEALKTKLKRQEQAQLRSINNSVVSARAVERGTTATAPQTEEPSVIIDWSQLNDKTNVYQGGADTTNVVEATSTETPVLTVTETAMAEKQAMTNTIAPLPEPTDISEVSSVSSPVSSDTVVQVEWDQPDTETPDADVLARRAAGMVDQDDIMGAVLSENPTSVADSMNSMSLSDKEVVWPDHSESGVTQTMAQTNMPSESETYNTWKSKAEKAQAAREEIVGTKRIITSEPMPDHVMTEVEKQMLGGQTSNSMSNMSEDLPTPMMMDNAPRSTTSTPMITAPTTPAKRDKVQESLDFLDDIMSVHGQKGASLAPRSITTTPLQVLSDIQPAAGDATQPVVQSEVSGTNNAGTGYASKATLFKNANNDGYPVARLLSDAGMGTPEIKTVAAGQQQWVSGPLQGMIEQISWEQDVEFEQLVSAYIDRYQKDCGDTLHVSPIKYGKEGGYHLGMVDLSCPVEGNSYGLFMAFYGKEGGIVNAVLHTTQLPYQAEAREARDHIVDQMMLAKTDIVLSSAQ